MPTETTADRLDALAKWALTSENRNVPILKEDLAILIDCYKRSASVLDALESMCYQHCFTQRVERDYNGQVAGTLVTDSGALSTNAAALETLADHGRFRIVAAGGRMIVGYWPENDPSLANKKHDKTHTSES